MREKIHLLKRNSFPAHSFFDHLLRGTDFFQDREFERAAEEWGAAGRLNYTTPINLTRRKGRIFCGGYIQEVPFLYFLYAVHTNRADGIGAIKTDGVAKNLFFNQGRLVCAATSRREERVGQLMVKQHRVPAATLARMIADSKKQGKRIGQLMVEKGLLSADALREVLIAQADRILVDIFKWRRGYFYFFERQIIEDLVVDYAPLNLTRIATCSGISFAEFRQKIPNMKTIFRLSPYAEAKRSEIMDKLTGRVKFIFSLIDGVRSIEQLARFGGLDPATTMDILYRLITEGIIRQSREIIEYEDKQFNEISNGLDTLLEIHAFIAHLLYFEIGAKATEIIRQAQQPLTRMHRGIFSGIPLEKSDKINKDMLLRNIAQYCPEPDKRNLFVEAFGAFFKQMQTAIEKNLGSRLAEHITRKIKTEIKNIERYAQETALRRQLLEVFAKLVY